MEVVYVEVKHGQLRKPLSQCPKGLKIFLENNQRMHQGRTSLQKSILMRVTLSRICLKPNSSAGALNGASYQLPGTDTETYNRMGLYLGTEIVSECSHWRCLSQHTLSFRKSRRRRGKNLLVTCQLLYIYHPSLNIKKPGHHTRIYEAPNTMTPPCFSVLQYSTFHTNFKG